MSLTTGIFWRETGAIGPRGFGVTALAQQRNLLNRISFAAEATQVPLPPSVETAGIPIVCAFNKSRILGHGHLLAVGGEEGNVTIAATDDIAALKRGTVDGSWRPRAHLPCHRNSIFDLAWAKDDSIMYTASGNQQIGIWDTSTARGLAVAEGHDGSVKTVAPLPLCEDIFASGARDGRIMLWDVRSPGTTGGRAHSAPGTPLDGAAALSPVWSQDGAHTRPPAPGAGRTSSKAAKHSPVTVTSVAFIPNSYLLASGGAQDTVVKLWDLRMHGLPCCELELPKLPTSTGRGGKGRAAVAVAAPHEVAASCCPSRGAAVGITHIAISPSGDRLLVSCLDSQHHLLSLSRLDDGPLATWCAPAASKASFYMRSAFSPCGDYVLSGSRDCGGHIWSVHDTARPPVSLPHASEVTGVAWCGSNWAQVATCSDSAEVHVWTLSRLPAREGPLLPAPAADAALAKTTSSAVAAPVAPAALPKAAPSATAAKPIARRLVQSRLNLSRAPKEAAAPAVPVPAPVAPVEAPAATAAAPSAQPLLDQVVVTPKAIDMLLPADAGAGCSSAGCRDTGMPTHPAERSGGSTGSGSASRRRSGPVPPVPIFSPAVNSWLQPEQLRADQQQQQAPALACGIPLPSELGLNGQARVAAVDAAPTVPAVPSTLEEAMLGLPQVRTQSPARADAVASRQAAPAVGTPTRPAAPMPGFAFAPASAMRAPAVSPRNAGSSFQRSRSRLGPFSPCHSHSSGSGRTGASTSTASMAQSSGGSGTPRPSASTGGHQAPQGIVTQLMRNSPRPGTAPSPRAAVAPESFFSLTPSRGHSPPEADVIEHVAGGSGQPVGRKLFAADAGPPPPSPRQRQPPSARAQGDNSARNFFGVPASPRASPHASPRASPRVGGGFMPLGSPMRSPRVSGGMPPTCSPIVFDICDGADVGPALRHRALHPEDSGPFDDGVLADAEIPTYSDDEDEAGANSDEERAGAGARGAAMQRAMPGFARRRRAASPLRGNDLFGAGALDADLAQLRALALGPSGAGAGTAAAAGEQHHQLASGSWTLRSFGSDEGCELGHAVRGGAGGLLPSSDDSDTDWEVDPFGDKENTPPPEELEGPVAALPASTAVPASPRITASGATGALPRPARSSGHTGNSGSPPPSTRPGHRVSDSQAQSEAQPITSHGSARAMSTPFAAAPPFAVGAEVPAARAAEAAPVSAPSLHSVPTFSQDFMPAARYHSRASSDGDGGAAPEGMDMEAQEASPDSVSSPPRPAPVPAAATAAAAPPGSVRRRSYAGRDSPAGPGHFARTSADAAGGPSQLQMRLSDNPTPTKRARRSYGCDGSADGTDAGAGTCAGSPTRAVSTGAAGAQHLGESLGAMLTPRGKLLRPPGGVLGGFGCAAGPAARPLDLPPPSPAVRPSVSRDRSQGLSRMLPGAVAIAARFAAAASAEAGSESPAPKVGTASRTGNRTNPDFFRRAAEEEREHQESSPFGFGRYRSAPEPAPTAYERQGQSAAAVAAAAIFAAAGNAEAGSESPAPKVGTASRTGNRTNEGFFRRAAEEERQQRGMSPFGFGRFGSSQEAAPRRAPAAAAAATATFAAAGNAETGSESPLPKVGTASRTGNRANTDFFRRAAEEEREQRGMSPFGFGRFQAEGDTSAAVPAAPPGAAAAAAAAILAAAGNQDAGSESPAPKVGTASRTGTRSNAEYRRRCAEEEREQRAGAVMSPFGFGLLSPSPAPRRRSSGGGGLAADEAAGHRLTSRFAAAAAPCGGPASVLNQINHLLGSPARVEATQLEEQGARASHPREEVSQGQQGGELEGEDEDVEQEQLNLAMECSVKSLSVIFETQTQEDTGVVPATYPSSEDDNNGGGANAEAGQPRSSGALFHGAARSLRALFDEEEERTVASPQRFNAGRSTLGAAAAAATVENDDDDDFELCSESATANMERCGSVNFGPFFSRMGTSSQLQPPAQPQAAAVASRPGLPLDESSRCFPVAMLRAPHAETAVAAAVASQSPQVRHQAPVPAAAAAAGAAPVNWGQQMAVASAYPRIPGPAAPRGRARGVAAAAAAAAAAQQRKPKQQTLQQCWAAPHGPLQGAAEAAVAGDTDHRMDEQEDALGLALGVPVGQAAGVASRAAQGPAALTSPRYFR